MKNVLSILLMGLFGTMVLFTGGCEKSNPEPQVIDPFSNVSGKRDMVVVVSDMHLGADLAYAECNKNLAALEKLLLKIKASTGVKEIVIAGDLIDEWFVPANIDTYRGEGQEGFVQRLAATNKSVFDVFNAIIQEGVIKLTYVPGNHDLAITGESIELILPGINQARDEGKLGLGTYTPSSFPELAIEHGHRYNFFCAPDKISNQDIASGTIMPPGYFFTRIAALSVVEKNTSDTPHYPEFEELESSDHSQQLLSDYWCFWKWVDIQLPILESNDEKIIVTNMNGFTGSYAVTDVVPYENNDGLIVVDLYNGIQDTWEARQKQNNVNVLIETQHAIRNGNSSVETDNLAVTQYFHNEGSNKRIVIFGHSHVSNLIASENIQGQKTIYANAGTWIDHNPAGTKANFVVITPQNDSDATSKTLVKVYNFEDEIITEEHGDLVRL